MTVIISEKYNAAEQIADALSNGTARQSSKYGTPVFTWGTDMKCVGLAGHVVGLEFDSEYEDWNDCKPSQLIDAEVHPVPTKPDIVSTVKELATQADQVTIATDFDREGELIGKEALNIAQSANPDLTVDRVRFSALTTEEIRSAFDSPTSMDFSLAAAGRARQLIDLRWGASLTRFLTLASSGSELVSVGRVQTPTLKLLVDREREIKQFDPDDYWEITADFRIPPRGDTFEAQYYETDADESDGERIWDSADAQRTYTDISGAFKSTVESVTESTRRDNPPVPFNTTEFISAANTIDFDVKEAMSAAEDLYDEGYVTYPRTDNTTYPESLQIDAILQALSTSPTLDDSVARVREQDEITPTSGSADTTDHPPIHPTETVPSQSDVSDNEWDIYKLISRRFLATVGPHAVWKRVRVDISVGDEHSFKATGRQLTTPGYHDIYPYFDTTEGTIPVPNEGEMLQVDTASVDEKQTRPPNRYGQSRLIKKMESVGVGTKATRHNVIDTLYERDYVSEKPPKPTGLAMALVDAVDEHAEPITTPEMTATLEDNMTAIAEGDRSLERVTGASTEMLDDLFESLESAKSEIGTAIRAELADADTDSPDESDAVGCCPQCGEWLLPREAESGSQFISCQAYPDCEFSLPLPNTGRVHLLDETCDSHNLHHVKMIAGKKTRVFGCPQCQQTEAANTEDTVIGDCPSCSTGDLAIKRVQTGSRLLGCTTYPDCDYSLPLPREGEITITDEQCSDHHLPGIEIENPDFDSPWDLGCPICNHESR